LHELFLSPFRLKNSVAISRTYAAISKKTLSARRRGQKNNGSIRISKNANSYREYEIDFKTAMDPLKKEEKSRINACFSMKWRYVVDSKIVI
jgi:hypothetical protein